MRHIADEYGGHRGITYATIIALPAPLAARRAPKRLSRVAAEHMYLICVSVSGNLVKLSSLTITRYSRH